MGGLWGYRLKLVRNEGSIVDNLPGNLTKFSFKSLEKATKKFSIRVGGIGYGFPTPYKGTLENGSKVIVKVFINGVGGIDFFSMIRIMSRIRHRNVVNLIGYCIQDDHRIIVHEFVGDYSLYELLFDHSTEEHAKLDWPVRSSICLGVARALEYLIDGVNPPIVNRDVKPGNVIVDRSFNPKIVDFDIACFFEDADQTKEVAGTMGYLDPECFITGAYTEKTDVYAFGVLLLEVIGGRRNIGTFGGDRMGRIQLVDQVKELQESELLEIVDPTLVEYPESEVIRFIKVALFCIQPSSDHRPSMFEVWLMLSGGYDFSKKRLGRSWDSHSSSNEDELNGPALGNLIDI